jgi:hypothetical protein
MKPLILEYTEKSTSENFDFSKIEYSEKLNLNVDKKSGIPAIEYLNLSTETFTKTFNETSDSDVENINLMMGTLTKTYTEMEATDDDASFCAIKSMMETTTLTLVATEGSDNDS